MLRNPLAKMIRRSHRPGFLDALLVVLMASELSGSFAGCLENLRTSAMLCRYSWSRRREITLGHSYWCLRRVRDEIPPNASVALLAYRPSDASLAHMANNYLYPRKSRIYWSVKAVEKNEAEGLPRERPTFIVLIDEQQPIEVRVVTLPELRALEVR